MGWTLTVVVFASAPSVSMAQVVADVAPLASSRAIVRVNVDLAAGAFDRILPFDVPFFITGRSPDGARSLEVQYAVIPKSGDTSALVWIPEEPARWQPDRPSTAADTFLVLIRTPLDAGRSYRLRFVFRNAQSADTLGTADGRTEQKNYVSLDAGLLYAGDLGIGALYVGGNIYFRPINKDAPLTAVSGIGRRLALTVGLTVSSVADDNNRTRSDLFWNQSFVLGAGLRLASSVRGGGGVLLFRQSDPNPLVTRKSAAVSWYASFSFDLDLLRGLVR
jgi:hypothetical protein